MAISVDDRATSARLRQRLDLAFSLLSDTKLKVIAAYGVTAKDREIAVPAVFIVDRQRRIIYRHVGQSITDRPAPERLFSALRSKSPQS